MITTRGFLVRSCRFQIIWNLSAMAENSFLNSAAGGVRAPPAKTMRMKKRRDNSSPYWAASVMKQSFWVRNPETAATMPTVSGQVMVNT